MWITECNVWTVTIFCFPNFFLWDTLFTSSPTKDYNPPFLDLFNLGNISWIIVDTQWWFLNGCSQFIITLIKDALNMPKFLFFYLKFLCVLQSKKSKWLPNEQFFNYIIATTNYNLCHHDAISFVHYSSISWIKIKSKWWKESLYSGGH